MEERRNRRGGKGGGLAGVESSLRWERSSSSWEEAEIEVLGVSLSSMASMSAVCSFEEFEEATP